MFRMVMGAMLIVSVGCASGSLRNTGSDPGVIDADPSRLVSKSESEAFFELEIVPVLNMKCANCHLGPGTIAPAFLGEGVQVDHDALVDHPSLLADSPEASQILLQGEHGVGGSSTFFSIEEMDLLRSWIRLRSEE